MKLKRPAWCQWFKHWPGGDQQQLITGANDEPHICGQVNSHKVTVILPYCWFIWSSPILFRGVIVKKWRVINTGIFRILPWNRRLEAFQKLKRNTTISVQANVFEYVVCKIAYTLSRPQRATEQLPLLRSFHSYQLVYLKALGYILGGGCMITLHSIRSVTWRE